jgi:hypothetical protein
MSSEVVDKKCMCCIDILRKKIHRLVGVGVPVGSNIFLKEVRMDQYCKTKKHYKCTISKENNEIIHNKSNAIYEHNDPVNTAFTSFTSAIHAPYPPYRLPSSEISINRY